MASSLRNCFVDDLVYGVPGAAQMPVDDGSPGVHDRVHARTKYLLLEFQLVAQRERDANGNDDPQELREVLAVATRLAEALRGYCGQLPDNAALRGGLAELATFVELTWGCDAVGFHPPELQEAGARAA